MAETVQKDEDIEVQIEEDQNDLTVEVEQEAASSDSDQSNESKEEEIENYGKGVQKRIDKLTYNLREAERREKAAIEYAKGLQETLDKNKSKLSQQQKNLYDEYSARVASDLRVAEDNYKKAYDLGDSEAMLQAQKDVARLSVESESLKRVPPPKVEVEKTESVDQALQRNQQLKTQQTPAQPDPKAQEWAKQNDSWFGHDVAMTTSAYAFHEVMVTNEGYDPTSDEYWSELDKRLMDAFPHKLGKGSKKNVQENVAVSSKGATGRRSGRTIKLTPSQVAIAKRLGVPLEEYAKHVKV